jgi:Flp pilus assembly pilin Flp
MTRISALLRDESGATMAEYGIIAAGLAIPFIGVALTLVATAAGTLSGTTTGMQSVGVNPP